MLRDILIKEWMSKNVVSATPDTPITEAHSIMKKNNIRRLPILEKGKIVGIITIGDVREAGPSDATTLSIWELNYLWSQIRVKSIMSTKVFTVTAEEPMINAARIMLEHKVSGLPVLDAKGKIVGIVTESDIFRMLVKSQTETI